MKKALFIVLALVISLSVLAALASSWWKSNTKPVGNNQDKKRFVIPRGSSALAIGNELKSKGLIRSSFAFKFYVQLVGAQRKIQAGEYDLSPSMSLVELVERLTHGPDEIWVTIPEGLRREEIVEKFISSFALSGNKANLFRVNFLQETEEKEGFLFPDTYLFPRTASASIVVSKMIDTFDKKVDAETLKDISSAPLGLNQTIVLASIIERETRSSEERSTVAGILIKRLENDWALQVDATVQYAMSNVKCQMSNVKCDSWWPILTKEDLEIDSPYNSYQRTGLPPYPIANPGLSSIKAVTYPTDTEYWFYLHDSNGGIHYAKTLEEHNFNIRKYLSK